MHEHVNKLFILDGQKKWIMDNSIYKVVELIGSSSESWDDAAKAAVERASKSLRDLRIAEVIDQDIQIEAGKIKAYRVKLKVSFKFEG